MSAFIILRHQDDPETAEKLRTRIEKQYPKPANYKFADNVYMVTGDRLLETVTGKLGLDDDTELHAAVLRLGGTYGGRSWRNMRDWFAAAETPR